MKYRVIVRPEAEDDLKGAFSWYEDKRAGLGHDFLLQFDKLQSHFTKTVEHHHVTHDTPV